MSEAEDIEQREVRASLRLGWSWLLLGACAGVVLETLHGFKIGPYLDDELTRLLLTLAHAHAVGLALVVLVYAVAGAPLMARRWPGHLLRASSLLVPLGFGLGAIGHPEGDPSLPILLVPVGALLLLVGLTAIAHAAFRST
ncbi:MAG: hypothetical protein JJ863_27355 [Deltaproteobacteria bacterium]|nr:hypothetical protein [Deltaproteobacteria bacterium]